MVAKREGIPEIMQGAEIRKVKEKISSEKFIQLKNWARKSLGNCLFFGEPGRGKSYAAVALMYWFEYLGIHWHDQKFIEIPQLNQDWLANIRTYENNYSLLEVIKNKRVVIFDDIGIRNPSDGFLDFLHTGINHRCNSPSLITIYTTNLKSGDLNASYGPRIVSRISDGLILHFDGPDLR